MTSVPKRALPAHIVSLAWASFISQLVIIGTGGAVRLTGSGLGCDTWPRCTPQSWSTTPEQGIHGLIEFTNRTLTGVLIAIAVAMLWSLWSRRTTRRDLWVLSVIAVLGVPAQAVLGGITVLTHLNAFVVGAHYLLSIVLVAVTAVLVIRVYETPGPKVSLASRWLRIVAHVTSAAVLIVVVLGNLATGSGPHAGDASAPRNGLDVETIYHVHATAAYAVVLLTLVVLVGAVVQKIPGLTLAVVGLLIVEALQVFVGITQARFGLPGVLVGIHMVLAGLLVAATCLMVMRLRGVDSAEGAIEPTAPGAPAMTRAAETTPAGR